MNTSPQDPALRRFTYAGGRCECSDPGCHFPIFGRCPKTFKFAQRARSDQTGWQLDHLVPLVSGGSDTFENHRVMCVECHKNTPSYGRVAGSKPSKDDALRAAAIALSLSLRIAEDKRVQAKADLERHAMDHASSLAVAHSLNRLPSWEK